MMYSKYTGGDKTMNPETVKELKNYLNPGKGWKIVGIVLAVLAVLSLILSLIPAVLCLAAAGSCFWRRKVAEQTLMGAITEEITRDFSASQPMFEGELRVGNQYLFGKNSGAVVAYGHISRVYENIQKTAFLETNRNLMYKDASGKARSLCKLPLKGRAAEDVMKVMIFIRTKNPGVRLGYH